MAKILCSHSGIEFTCEHFPVYLHSRECSHPIFSVPQKKLLAYASKWSAGELTPTDSYLLFLALLHSTDQVEFRVPAQRTLQTDQIVANNMESLFHVVGKINIIKHPAFVIPRFVFSPETKNLDTAHYWILAWESCLEDFTSGYVAARKNAKTAEELSRRESALEKLIRSAQKDIMYYAGSLAEWAAIAGNFPDVQVQETPFGRITLAEYWKAIIRRCCRAESIFLIPRSDLDELYEHCQDNIDQGSIFSFTLMNLLRSGRAKHSGFLGLTDLDSSSNTFQILNAEDSVETANKLMMIQSAPTEEPKASQYATRIAYLRDKAKWDMAQRHASNANPAIQTPLGEI